MSQERVIRTLASFGLTRTDAKVYIYLAKKGSQKAKDLSNFSENYKAAAISLHKKPAEQGSRHCQLQTLRAFLRNALREGIRPFQKS